MNKAIEYLGQYRFGTIFQIQEIEVTVGKEQSAKKLKEDNNKDSQILIKNRILSIVQPVDHIKSDIDL